MSDDNIQLQILQAVGEIRAEVATTAAEIAALNARLFNSGSGVIADLKGDIAAINTERKEEKKWDKITDSIHYGIAPVLVGLHIIAHKLGIKI